MVYRKLQIFLNLALHDQRKQRKKELACPFSKKVENNNFETENSKTDSCLQMILYYSQTAHKNMLLKNFKVRNRL